MSRNGIPELTLVFTGFLGAVAWLAGLGFRVKWLFAVGVVMSLPLLLIAFAGCVFVGWIVLLQFVSAVRRLAIRLLQ